LTDTAIDIQDLRKVYKVGGEKVVALDHITLSIALGEICCILGTSGSGKSTLLNMMAGLEKPTRGRILIGNSRIDRMSEKDLAAFRQKNLGFVFQSYNLLPALTALENVYLPLTFRGISPKIRERRAWEILTAVGLKTHARHKPTQMSGGQQQRVGIARAFVAKPAIVFADEPTGNLDTRTTQEVMQLIVGLVHTYKQTLVLVTHDPEVAAFADRIVHIIDGNIDHIRELPHTDSNTEVPLADQRARIAVAAPVQDEIIPNETEETGQL
jgi:putative ABC transport system ATP-binding protein